MIKLVYNELIKIFKRKSIYLLFLLSIIAIIVYNKINPDQNPIRNFNYGTEIDYPITEKSLEDSSSVEYFIVEKTSTDIHKLCNSFEKNSWQRFALSTEPSAMSRIYPDVFPTSTTFPTDYNADIYEDLIYINDYEFNPDSEISLKLYRDSKDKYNEYLDVLNNGDWKDFVNLKIKNLEDKKLTTNLKSAEIEEIDFEIEWYNLRLKNNIIFNGDMANLYLDEYKELYYFAKQEEIDSIYFSDELATNQQNITMTRMNLCKYALQNNLTNQDISNENNVLSNNIIDARNSFIRTFQHFDLIIIIIAIYISSIIVTEEVNKHTIKTLLTKPHKRSTILISKLLASIITIIISMIFVSISQYIIGGIIFGFDSYNLSYIGYDLNSNQIIIMSLFKYIALIGLLKLPMYIIIITFCIFIGTINKHSSMSMVLTLIIISILNVIKLYSENKSFSSFAKYIIWNNCDFSIFLFGQVSRIVGVTIQNSIIICLIHMVLLVFLSIIIFNKKEIENV